MTFRNLTKSQLSTIFWRVSDQIDTVRYMSAEYRPLLRRLRNMRTRLAAIIVQI